MRPDETILEPAAAAEVPRVEVPATVAPKLTAVQRQDIDKWLKKLYRQFGHCSNRRLEERLRRRGTGERFQNAKLAKSSKLLRSVRDRRKTVATFDHGRNVSWINHG